MVNDGAIVKMTTLKIYENIRSFPFPTAQLKIFLDGKICKVIIGGDVHLMDDGIAHELSDVYARMACSRHRSNRFLLDRLIEFNKELSRMADHQVMRKIRRNKKRVYRQIRTLNFDAEEKND